MRSLGQRPASNLLPLDLSARLWSVIIQLVVREDERGAAVRGRPVSQGLTARRPALGCEVAVYLTPHSCLSLAAVRLQGRAPARHMRLFGGLDAASSRLIRFPLDFSLGNAIACSVTFISARRTRQDWQLGKHEASVVNAARRRSGREHAAEGARN
jgi:hypothetical protein